MKFRDAPPSHPARRQLLAALASLALLPRAGTAWATLATPSATTATRLPDGMGHGHSVLILGAGIAGLVAAHELTRAGCRVRVVEARGRVGGRCWTLRGGDRVEEYGAPAQTCDFPAGQYLNAGANRILPGHRGLLDYTHQFNLPLEIFLSGPQSETWLLRRAPGHPLTGRKQRFRQINRDEIGHAMARLVELLARETPAHADSAGLTAWARRFGDLDEGGHYQGSAAGGYRTPPGGADQPAQVTNPIPAPELWSYGKLGDVPASVNSAAFPTPVLTITGGMDRLPKALAATLPPECLQLGAELVRLRQDESGVTVTWRDLTKGTLHEESADLAICTLPFTLLNKIEGDFSPDFQAIIGSLAYEHVVKVGLDFRRRFWELDDGIHGGYSFMDDPALALMYPSQGLGQADGLLTAYYPSSRDSLRMTGLSPDARIRAALNDVEQFHPGAGAALRSAVSVAWARIPWSAGCASLWTPSGWKNDLPRLAEGDRRVLFAGEHVSHIPAWMEGAIQSAFSALNRLQRRWTTTGGST